MYINLLLLCGIFCHGIIGTFADEDIRNSSNILVRQKRVINRIQGEDQKVPISKARYIVHIKHRLRIKCVGSILALHVAITIPACVQLDASQYQVVSRSARSSRGNTHRVIDIKKKFYNDPNRSRDGIALLTVDPNFWYGAYASSIQLHSEPLLPGTLATVSGWGFASGYTADCGTKYPIELRSIQVPIMNHQECAKIYRSHNIEISDQDVCTYHPKKYCGHNDAGAPLVVNDQLVGIHIWTGLTRGQYDPQYPDVFVLVQDFANYQWITSNVNTIEASLFSQKKNNTKPLTKPGQT